MVVPSRLGQHLWNKQCGRHTTVGPVLLASRQTGNRPGHGTASEQRLRRAEIRVAVAQNRVTLTPRVQQRIAVDRLRRPNPWRRDLRPLRGASFRSTRKLVQGDRQPPAHVPDPLGGRGIQKSHPPDETPLEFRERMNESAVPLQEHEPHVQLPGSAAACGGEQLESDPVRGDPGTCKRIAQRKPNDLLHDRAALLTGLRSLRSIRCARTPLLPEERKQLQGRFLRRRRVVVSKPGCKTRIITTSKSAPCCGRRRMEAD